ncbi:ribosomal protein L7/L12 [Sinimarinibacterium sp. CAU 1509]|uniref:ribosomal protein L7/L12 n=1 Tax=Sinimarinibacterium sp. CAU 1509 TaxID=2562283 RepID=UPI001B7F8AB2|nr:ribosomal protein L7/L12 [Sinimarinibacterium sp. CAU 1509]
MNDEATQLVALVASGNKIEAIKLLRKVRGLGLSEAKDAVERIASLADAQRELQPRVRVQQASPNSGLADAEVQRLIRAGQTLAAIKRVRDLTGCGLREAKRAVDTVLPPHLRDHELRVLQRWLIASAVLVAVAVIWSAYG